MKNTIKVALGFAAGGALILLNELRKRKKMQKNNFVAPDGNEYQKDRMYRNAEGEIFRNGRKLHFETPQHLVEANHKIDSNLARNSHLNDQNPINRNVNYHKRGVRHH
jgi:cytochrome c